MRSLGRFLIALGGNQPSAVGSPAQSLRAALDALVEVGCENLAISGFYATPCFPAGADPDYVNAAAAFDFDASPADVLSHLHRIEAMFGRERVQRWGRRTLDLDMIAAGDIVLPDAQTHRDWRELPLERQMEETPGQLILPHPRMQDRAFVLVPLADVAPDWRHPVLGSSVAEMLNALSQHARDEVVAL